MTLGRPALPSNESEVPLPSAIDDEYLGSSASSSCEQPDGIFSRANFYIQAIKLYQIMGRMLANVYRPWTTVATKRDKYEARFKDSSVAVVLDMDTELTRWESMLPHQLHWNQRKSFQVDEVTERQSNVLHARLFPPIPVS